MASVRLKNICKSYNGIPISKDINLEIEQGEFVVFVGPSGCGKSTLLRVIAGLEDITSGDLYIGSERVNDKPPMARSVGMVFQSYALYPHLSVAENMAFGLKLAKVKQAEIDQRVQQAAEILQLTHLLARKPKDLSGGQRQRVAIGRTMVREPQVFLFDEPLSNLDAALRVQMRIEIAKLHKRLQATMIYVTHDQVEAMTMADKIVVLDSGRIAQVGKPLELYHYPANRFVAGFIGSPMMNFIQVQVEKIDAGGVQVRLPDGQILPLAVDGSHLSQGGAALLGLRPEHFVSLEASEYSLSGQVNVVERLGDQTLIYLDAPGCEAGLTVRRSGNASVQEGESYRIGIDLQHAHLFLTDGAVCEPLLRKHPC